MTGDVILITGGAGFIGSAVVRHLIRASAARVINMDALTYAANLANVADVAAHPRYSFERVDIRSLAAVERVFKEHRPTAVLHIAAETHVDRSIDQPAAFIETNVCGTYAVLEAVLRYWSTLAGVRRERLDADIDRRSLWIAGRRRTVSRRQPLSTEFALFREQGGGRPSGAGLVRHLRIAGHRIELLQQLWSLSAS
jgi:NAD(P)-dependent dehydrogenase (short-subunit alcohol dehydrogenase family)